MKNLLLKGDALSLLPTLEAGSFDALITDPPYASGGLTAAPARGRHRRSTFVRICMPTSWAMSATNARTCGGW